MHYDCLIFVLGESLNLEIWEFHDESYIGRGNVYLIDIFLLSHGIPMDLLTQLQSAINVNRDLRSHILLPSGTGLQFFQHYSTFDMYTQLFICIYENGLTGYLRHKFNGTLLQKQTKKLSNYHFQLSCLLQQLSQNTIVTVSLRES